MIYEQANILHGHLTIELQGYSAIGRVKIFTSVFYCTLPFALLISQCIYSVCRQA